MAGHSQFANIKHRKDAQDAKKSKKFIKIAKEITVAVKKNGANIETNSALRTILEKARSCNMPKENYERVIKKASGANNNEDYQEIRYEGYGPFGIAIIVDCLTDNRNRTAANVRNCFTKNNGSLGITNSVSYLFVRKAMFIFYSNSLTLDQTLEWVLEIECDNIENEDNNFIITADPEQFNNIKQFLTEKQITDFIMCDIVLNPLEIVQLDSEAGKKVQQLIDLLEDDDDVQNVYHNGQW